MLDKLSNVLRKTTDKIANAVFLDKDLVEGIVKELQRALIEADVSVSLVKEISDKIKKEAFDERIKGIEKKEHIIKLLHGELVKILGRKREVVLGKKNVFLMVGLYGVGKTTSIGKLASYYSKRGHKVCSVGLDVYRAAAMEQLRQVSEKVKVKCFVDNKEKNPLKIWENYAEEIKKYDVVLVDSAGRDALDKELISEIKDVGKIVKPTEIFLVMSSDIGQAAKKQAQAFKEAVGVTGVFITRMDSTAKGGGALSACAEVKAPVVFIGTGENPGDIESFDPEAFLSRLLGMGDLKTLMEKIHSVMDKKDIERQQKKLEEGKFDLGDFREQLDSMSELGSFDKLIGMVPGLGNVKDKVSSEHLEEQQNKTKRWRYIIDSMTREEKEHPELFDKQTSRIQRVARGSGTTTTEVRMLLKQFKMMQEMIKSQSSLMEGKLDQRTLMKFARKFGKKMKF
ncbi:MAG: signal recognition particle receptor subunit alpha [Nanoarchaeota archaeon]